MKYALYIITFLLLMISFIASREKTFTALKKAYKKLIKIASLFMLVLAGFALVVTYLPSQLLQQYIGMESGLRGIFIALGLGSISVMPGFAAYPLSAALRSEGIPYYIIAAFILSLMNVGFVTFPIEKKFLGFPVALIRNVIALVICIIAVIVVKFLFGE